MQIDDSFRNGCLSLTYDRQGASTQGRSVSTTSTKLTFDAALRAKEEVLSGRSPSWFAKAMLVDSWQRSMAALGDPGALREVPIVSQADLDDEPLHLLGEPLVEMADALRDSPVAMLLANPQGVVLARWFSDPRAGRHLDSTGSIRGANLSESTVGTNAVGAVAATGQAARILGPEHFCDFFSHSACTAEPIRDPATGSVRAVLTLTCPATAGLDLLAGWGMSIRAHLEAHLRSQTLRPASPRVEHTEEWALRRALKQSGGDITLTCELLGLSRATVYRRMRRYRIETPSNQPSSDVST